MCATLSLAIIARDRGPQLQRALESVARYADEIVVVDAGGSTDNTVEVARSFGAKVISFLPEDHPEAFFDDVEERFAKHKVPGPFSGRKVLADFSAPRNVSFEACTCDYILWIDSDDVVLHPEALPSMVKIMVDDGYGALMFDYDYAHDSEGRVIVKQKRERLIKRGEASWRLPIHEHLHGPGLKGKVAYNDRVVISHRHEHVRRTAVSQGAVKIVSEQRDEVNFRNLKNLLVNLEVKEEKGDTVEPDLYFYLGNEWRVLDVEKAISYYERYLPLAESNGQRCQTRFFIGQIREAQQRWETAWNYMAGATYDLPENPSPWFSLARIALVRGEWQNVIRFSERGLEVASKQSLNPNILLDPQEVKYRALLPYTRALVEVGRHNEALKFCNEGLTFTPGCQFLSNHKIMCLEKLGGAS